MYIMLNHRSPLITTPAGESPLLAALHVIPAQAGIQSRNNSLFPLKLSRWRAGVSDWIPVCAGIDGWMLAPAFTGNDGSLAFERANG